MCIFGGEEKESGNRDIQEDLFYFLFVRRNFVFVFVFSFFCFLFIILFLYLFENLYLFLNRNKSVVHSPFCGAVVFGDQL